MNYQAYIDSERWKKKRNALKRGVILGTNTRLDLLEPADRKKHEAILERLAHRMALVSRSKPIYNLVKKEQPKLLGNA